MLYMCSVLHYQATSAIEEDESSTPQYDSWILKLMSYLKGNADTHVPSSILNLFSDVWLILDLYFCRRLIHWPVWHTV
jgi:hypothetical protein